MKCRKCGAGPNDPPYHLTRVNEKGVDGIWECRPACGHQQMQEQALLDALDPPPHDTPEGE